MLELKIIDTPRQTFSVKIADKRVRFHLYYNSVSERWSFDLYVGDALVLSGRRVILDSNLLHRFVNIDIGMLFAFDLTGQGNEPNRVNIPTGIVRLFSATQDEILESLNE